MTWDDADEQYLPRSTRGVREAHIPLDKVAPKYFGLSPGEARRRAPAKVLPCRVFRLSGQKSPWLVSAADLAELIDRQRERAR